MSPALIIIAAMAAPAAAPDRQRLPPEPVRSPQVRDLPGTATPPVIFTYTVDPACRVAGTRKLQGADAVTWRDAQEARQVYTETTTWRFVDGVRRQLRERRVKLLGEMILEGELVCHVLPSGTVVDAWIERRDTRAGRRQGTTREPVPVQAGAVADLGTFSLDFEPPAP